MSSSVTSVTSPIRLRHPHALKLFGPPGAGKTRELVSVLAEHVADGDFDLGDAIIVSFTNAAARDIANRVAPSGSPGRYHCTIHALCRRYLDMDTARIAEKHIPSFFRERGIPYKAGRRGDDPDGLSDVEAAEEEGNQVVMFWNWARGRFLSITEAKRVYSNWRGLRHWMNGDNLERLWAEYLAWKKEKGLFDFTDMLEEAVRYEVGMRTPCLVIDEAQDSSPLQWAALKGFIEKAERVYVAGDDDQAIYGFLGADAAEFLDMETGYVRTLHVNHRSGSKLVASTQKLIRRNTRRHDKEMVAAREGGSIQNSVFLPEMARDRSTMLLARANYQLNEYRREMMRYGTPFFDVKGKDGVNGTGGVAYERLRRLMKGRPVTLKELSLIYQVIPTEGWLERGAKQRLKDLAADAEQSGRLVRLADLFSFGAYESLVAAMKSDDLDFLHERMKAPLAYLQKVEQAWGPEYLDEERAREVCVVGTIHSQKGREADRVVLVNAWPKAAYESALSDPEAERRVLYVAETRARDEIIYLQARGAPCPV